jgi:hypothetical protein
MRVHLIQQEEKMVDGQTYTALCGEKVENSKSVCMWDEIAVGSVWNETLPTSTCWKCKNKLLTTYDPQYIFGIVDARKLDKRKGVA